MTGTLTLQDVKTIQIAPIETVERPDKKKYDVQYITITDAAGKVFTINCFYGGPRQHPRVRPGP